MKHEITQTRHTPGGDVITCSCGDRFKSTVLSADEMWERHVDKIKIKKGK